VLVGLEKRGGGRGFLRKDEVRNSRVYRGQFPWKHRERPSSLSSSKKNRQCEAARADNGSGWVLGGLPEAGFRLSGKGLDIRRVVAAQEAVAEADAQRA
jgi:hypothetical protein